MGNILKGFIGDCFNEEDDGGGNGRGRFPNSYPLASRPYYQPRGLADLGVLFPPPSPPPPQPRQQPQLRPASPLGYHHGVPWPTVEITLLIHDFLDMQFTSTVSEGLRHHSTSSRKAQHNHHRCIDVEKDNGSCKPRYCDTSGLKDNQGIPVLSPLPSLPIAPRGYAALELDLLNFAGYSKVPDRLAQHVTSSRRAQVKW